MLSFEIMVNFELTRTQYGQTVNHKENHSA